MAGDSLDPGVNFRSLRDAPLMWVAAAATAGAAVERTWPIPLVLTLAGAGALLAAWLLARRTAAILLLAAVAALGAARLHVHDTIVSADDVGRFATDVGAPVQLRATVASPPMRVPAEEDPLQTLPRPEAVRLALDAASLADGTPASGLVIAYVSGKLEDIAVGDEVEIFGRLTASAGAANPGEFDVSRERRDQGVRAILSATGPGGVRVLARRWPVSVTGWLGRLHEACKETLEQNLSVEPALAAALLLGDGSGMSRSEWDKFLQSGVVHALAISGQHLVVLAVFLAFLRRLLFMPLAPATLGIVVILFAYALLTGGRPPAVRAAWMVLVGCLAILGRRCPTPLNTLAFAWLGVLIVNPADIFQTGCQLSFLAVALLQGMPRSPAGDADPFAEASLVPPRIRRAVGWLGQVYLESALIWLGVTPLVAARFHLVSPIALVIGPPVVLATTVALLSGFLLLVTAPVLGPLAAPFAWATDAALWMCVRIIDLGLAVPGATIPIADVPIWWIYLFYVALPLPWMAPRVPRATWLALGVLWFLVAGAFGLGMFGSRGFHVAFLAVGHGGCTVVENDGRVLVYDAGATSGPDVTRRIILPYLWSRGRRGIDELVISHADLDHFSGVPDLVSRVPVGRVTLTPSFADRASPGVRRVMKDLAQHKIETRIWQAGDSDTLGDLTLDVLHPPARGPEGKENARSLVLLIRKDRFHLLLTGDLEEAGLDMLLGLRSPGVDVFMVPHHGSRTANPLALASWAKPRLAISCQGRPRGVQSPAAIYESVGARYWTTHREGAIELQLRDGQLDVTTFRTKETFTLGPPRVR